MNKIEGVNLLVDNADIGFVANSIGIETVKRGSSYFCLCPIPHHHDEHATNCFFKDGDNYMYCLVCHKTIDAIDLIRYTKGVPFYEAVRELWELSGCPDYVKIDEKKNTKKNLPLDYKTLRFLGITLPSYIPVPVGIDDYNRNAGRKKNQEKYSYMSNSLEYVRCKRERVTWMDFISTESLAEMVLNRAKEKMKAIQVCFRNIEDPYMKKILREEWDICVKAFSDCQNFLSSQNNPV
ncbi:CHC2 zinc finger domain-containing protein [Eubacterium sp. An3]|uniref:CHC2 zinc finger domain-containing protein n=1 Tax=Eubacterium sp. An3 TaxID=1965628 RepID=UPI000B39F584|nr:CHC2 zinc finger domain-containing protein [Eubacterium sp. An3]OUO25924.1 hypothetical protein B5F87_16055 [Eubacterium sp. An3]